MTYNVKINDFEGPIDLLMGNVTSGKIDVNSITLFSLVLEFIEAIDARSTHPLDTLSRFISVMTTLLRHKCRSMLGKTSEEDLDLDEISSAEEKELLLISILGATVFKEVSLEIQRCIEETSTTIARSVGPDLELVADIADPLRKISPKDLRDVFERMVSTVEQEVIDASHITTVPISVREVGEAVMGKIITFKKVTFAELIKFSTSRFEVVVSFLIILEGARAGVLILEMTEIDDKEGVLVSLGAEVSEVEFEKFAELIRAID